MSVFEWLDAAGRFAVIDGVVKAGVLMLAALFLASRLKRESAALRHALWAATFAALVVMPFAASLAAVWGVQVDAPAVRLQPAAAGLQPPAVTEAERVVAAPLAHTEGVAPAKPEGGLRGPDGESTAPSLLGRAMRVPWMTVAGIVYLVGCVALFVRLVVHLLLARGMGWRGSAPRGVVRRVMRDCRSAGLLTARTRVLVSDELGGPVTFGVFWPIIVLPQVAEYWPVDRVRAAVLHESAHVQRGDAIVQLIVGAVCAAYWPNPLVRLAARRQRLDQERACDDRTIRAGMCSHAYARHLIELARYGLAHRRLATALPAAGGELRQRIQAILDPRADRRTAAPRKLAASTVGLSIAVASAAAIGVPNGQPVSGQAGPQTAPDVAALADPDPTVRAHAAWSFGERELPAGIPFLLPRLRDEDVSVRTVTAWALGEVKDPRAVDALVSALRDDGDAFVREIAVLALGEIRDTEAAPALFAAFEEDEALRAAAAWAVRRLPRHAVSPSAARLAANTQPWLDLDQERLPAAQKGATPLAYNQAVQSLTHTDPAVRANAAWSLGIAGDAAAVDALIPRLRDEDATVRAAAVWALDEINPSRSRGSNR